MSLDDDLELLMHCNGLFEGQLTEEELAAFRRLKKAGWARVSYSGASGLLGLGKVSVTGPELEEAGR